MKKITILIVLMLIVKANAQTNDSVEKGLLKLSILTPSLEYELGLSKKSTLNFGIGTALNFTSGKDEATYFALTPTFNMQYRNYYNLERRLRKGKNVENNSGNYFSLLTKYEIEEALIGKMKNDHSNTFFVGTLYGIQRSYKNNMFFNVEGGFGFQKPDERDSIDTAILINIKFGWLLKKKNKKATH